MNRHRLSRRRRWLLLLVGLALLFTVPAAASQKTNMSYLYFGNPGTYLNQIDKTNGTLTTVSPNYLDILPQGQLDVTWKLDSTFIAEMKRRGVRVVPFLSNHWDRQIGIDALTHADKLTTQVAQAVQTYQFDGVNVDIEGVGAAYREAFTAFIRMLREKLPADKELSVAVAANPQGWSTGWHGFYDYPALAAAADYLMVMSYDESWEGGDPGPVSSIRFFERSLQFALNQGVGAQKLVMGIPFYGRLWKLDEAGGVSSVQPIRGVGVSNRTVNTLVTAYGGEFFYDRERQSPYATFVIPEGSGRYIAGRWCDGGSYILWFENERSIKQKLRFLGTSGVRGAGSWSLYQESDGTWDYFSAWLNGTYFQDLPSGHWAEDAVLRMSEQGWLQGISAIRFAPDGRLTRAQAAAIFARVLELERVPHAATEPSVNWRDVAAEHWAYDDIRAVVAAKVMQGTGGNDFRPDQPLTREQLAVLLDRILVLEKLPVEAPDSQLPLQFRDMLSDRWSYPAVERLFRQQIIQGVSSEQFGAREPTTRAQMAVLLARVQSRINHDTFQRREE
jgi:spore germination protein YaaH